MAPNATLGFFGSGYYAATGPTNYAFHTWGTAANGRLGNGTTSPDLTSPAMISNSNWSFIGHGPGFNAAIKSDGTLWTWGGNSQYQLGLGDTTDRTTPTQVGSGTDWAFVSCGTQCMAAIKTDGTLWTVGSNANYRTAQGTDVGNTTSLTKVGSATDWAWTSIGQNTLFVIKTNGDLYSCGSNLGYISAQGTNTGDTTALTKVTTGPTAWSKVQSGERNTNGAGAVGIGTDGKPYSWGNNQNYSTAQGTATGSTTSPTAFDTATTWTDVAANFSFGLGVSAGKLYSWGSNANYQTAAGTNIGSRTTETQVGTNTDWTGVAIILTSAGYAIRNSMLYSWGSNANGRTGQGTTAGSTNGPSRVGVNATWSMTAAKHSPGAASAHGLALMGSDSPVNTVAPTLGEQFGYIGFSVPYNGSPGTWTGATPITYTYNFQKLVGGTWTSVQNGATSSYDANSEVGETFRGVVTASNTISPDGTATSNELVVLG